MRSFSIAWEGQENGAAVKSGCLSVLVLAAVGVIIAMIVGNNPTTTTPAPPSCANDYTKCADNEDMVNHYEGMATAQSACKTKVDDSVRYGEPKWGWVPFGSFRVGTDFPKTGLVKIVEPDVQIPNGFGAMEHTRVECWYNFKGRTAVIVDASGR